MESSPGGQHQHRYLCTGTGCLHGTGEAVAVGTWKSQQLLSQHEQLSPECAKDHRFESAAQGTILTLSQQCHMEICCHVGLCKGCLHLTNQTQHVPLLEKPGCRASCEIPGRSTQIFRNANSSRSLTAHVQDTFYNTINCPRWKHTA